MVPGQPDPTRTHLRSPSLWITAATGSPFGHDSGMVIQLDPRYPIVWRTPTSVQIGVDDIRVVAELTPAQEHLLYAARQGVAEHALVVLGEQQGLSEADVARFIAAMRPALLGAPEPVSSLRVAVDGEGEAASDLRLRLGPALEPSGDVDLAVIVAHYVVDPEISVRWLSRDTRHLPVIFSDLGARLGPVIVPGHGPCLYCLDRERADSDPTWTAIETQLLGMRSLLDRGEFAKEVALSAARMVRDASEADTQNEDATSVTITPDGRKSVRVHRRHPACGCRSLGESVSAPSGDAVLPLTR